MWKSKLNHRGVHSTKWTLILLITSGMPLWGCSKSSTPALVKVRGKVTYQGAPITQGTISFVPSESLDEHGGHAATGIINSDGTYRLATFAENDGVVPGTYNVAVVSITSGPTLEEPGLPEVWAIPKKYGNAIASGLTASVPSDTKGSLELNFTLDE